MSEITQIRVGKHVTGIIGLKAALDEAAARCKDMPDDRITNVLLEILSKKNYIETKVKDLYAQAFLGEYKKHCGEMVSETIDQGFQIKVLGPGCPQCDRLEQEVMAAMSETGIMAELEHVRDVAEIGRYGVLGSPALVINNEVKAVGSMPPRDKIKAWIERAANQTKL